MKKGVKSEDDFFFNRKNNKNIVRKKKSKLKKTDVLCKSFKYSFQKPETSLSNKFITWKLLNDHSPTSISLESKF